MICAKNVPYSHWKGVTTSLTPFSLPGCHFGRPGTTGSAGDGSAGPVGPVVVDGIGGSPGVVLGVDGVAPFALPGSWPVGPDTGVTGVVVGALLSGCSLGAGGLIGVGVSGTPGGNPFGVGLELSGPPGPIPQYGT